MPRHAWVGLAAVLGCSSAHEAPPPAATVFLRDFDDVLCRRAIRCESSLPQRFPADVCHPDWMVWRGADRAVALGHARFDASRAASCLAAIEALPCGTPERFASMDAGCFGVFEPTLEVGDRCDPAATFSCGSGTYCSGTDPCTARCEPAPGPLQSCESRPCASGGCSLVNRDLAVCTGEMPETGEPCETICARTEEGATAICSGGTCVVAPIASAGDACGGHVADCLEGLICDGGICRAPGATGAPCEYDVACLDGLRCLSGSCAPLATAGEPCDRRQECSDAAPRCTRGVCSTEDEETPFCEVTLHLGVWVYHCPAGLACVDEDSSCRVPVALGAACDPFAPCIEGARCDAGRCRTIAAPGGACGAEVVCPLAFECRDGACGPVADPWGDFEFQDEGEPCGVRRGTCRFDLVCLSDVDDQAVCVSPLRCG
jgi:hypothetical protein